ncbi:MAG: hypothetical protein JSW11_20045 [Candidatus Heimdallarchaeota archaeon]|nr:MAG: hypothetical protein JSW11_20045 [Candidatus Heimdallarchaeota archaeon]
MGSLNLALKDIWRQKPRSLLFITVQSCITASGIIMYGLAVIIQSQLGQDRAYFNNSIIQIFNGYLNFLLSFAIVTGILVATILSCLLTVARMDDLAVILALGGTFKRIQRIPLAQIFLITLIAGLIGLIGGILSLFSFNLFLGFDTIVLEEILPLGLVYIIFQIIGTYFAAGFVVNLLIRKKMREIIDGQYEVVTVNQKKIWGIPTKGRIGFRLAYLFNKRSRILSWVMIGGTFMLIFLTAFGILGGSIIINTTSAYIERGYGTEVYVVTNPEIESLLKELYDPMEELRFDSSLLSSRYSIPAEFLNQLPVNCTFEARLLIPGIARMITEIKTENGTPIGSGDTTIETYYWGIDESNFSIFDYYGITFAPPGGLDIYIGDGMIRSYLNEERVGSIIPKGDNIGIVERFEIAGVIMDPFARGHCVYMDSGELARVNNIQNQNNVVFIKKPNSEIFNLVEAFNLKCFSLDNYKSNYLVRSNNFWLISSIAFIPAMISAGLSLVAYSGLIARVILIKDLRILRLIGGNPKTLRRVILWVNILLVLYAAPLAVLFGFISAHSFLIVEARLPSIQAWILLALEFLVMVLIIYRYIKSFFKDFYRIL